MLVGFSIANYRSFLGRQEFSYRSSADRTHVATNCVRTGLKSVPRLSKAAVVFGPNGSGKSNLINGLIAFRNLVLHSTDFTDTEFAEQHTPFQFGPSVGNPTEFAIDVLLDKIRYRYSLAYDGEGINAERLLVYQTGKSQRWFERDFDAASRREHWLPFSSTFNGPREMWRRATRRNALFLTTAVKLHCAQLRPLAHWFETGLDVLVPTAASDLQRVTALVQDGRTKQRAMQLLRCLGSEVNDIRMAESDASAGTSAGSAGMGAGATAGAQSGGRPLVEFLYRRDGYPPRWLESGRESSGTHRLLVLLGPLLHAIDRGKLLVIDEFDLSLHPLIARFIVRLVNDPDVNGGGVQVLLTSHNTALMDLDILRRDEIWLMELNSSRSSSLSRILKSSPRKNELIAKGYLRGRYGAVPAIDPNAAVLAKTALS